MTDPKGTLAVSRDFTKDYCSTPGYAAMIGFPGGTGTPGDPYTICSVAQLQIIGQTSAYWNSSFVLRADLDIGAPASDVLVPIGNAGQPYTGAFDGDGRVIRRVRFVTGAFFQKGLFGAISGATIRDLTLEAATIQGGGEAGTLVGHVMTSGNILRCRASGTVSNVATSIAGGLVGRASGLTLTDSGASVNVNCNGTCGGLVGVINTGTSSVLTRTFATGTVSGSLNRLGGLVGDISSTSEPVSQPPRSPDSGYRKPSFGMNPVIPAPNSARRTSLLSRRRGFSALLATA